MGKADRALTSAPTLLAAKDCDGACNSAYYAMFDAAHAALPRWLRTPLKPASIRIAVLSAFSANASFNQSFWPPSLDAP